MAESRGVVAQCQPFCAQSAAMDEGTGLPVPYMLVGCQPNRAKTAEIGTRCFSAVQRLHEVPQLDGRKFPEPLLDLALRQFQEDPTGRAASLPAHEVHPPA